MASNSLQYARAWRATVDELVAETDGSLLLTAVPTELGDAVVASVLVLEPEFLQPARPEICGAPAQPVTPAYLFARPSEPEVAA